jgi:MYXO-CTERM domain-containing protein
MMRFAQTGMMLAGLAVLPLAAQSTSPSPSTSDMSRSTPMTTEMSRTTDMHDDDDFNFGWLGLLGLAGLAGLGRKKHHVHTDHVHTGHMHTDDRDRV